MQIEYSLLVWENQFQNNLYRYPHPLKGDSEDGDELIKKDDGKVYDFSMDITTMTSPSTILQKAKSEAEPFSKVYICLKLQSQFR